MRVEPRSKEIRGSKDLRLPSQPITQIIFDVDANDEDDVDADDDTDDDTNNDHDHYDHRHNPYWLLPNMFSITMLMMTF